MSNIVNLKDAAARYAVQELEISGWGPRETITVRAKRPTLYAMAAMGFIPNPLMGAMQAMLSGDVKKVEAVDLKKQADCVIAMARYALVEPTYDQMTDAGLTLNDDQLMELYMFALGGLDRVAAFRALRASVAGNDVTDIPDAPEPAAGD